MDPRIIEASCAVRAIHKTERGINIVPVVTIESWGLFASTNGTVTGIPGSTIVAIETDHGYQLVATGALKIGERLDIRDLTNEDQLLKDGIFHATDCFDNITVRSIWYMQDGKPIAHSVSGLLVYPGAGDENLRTGKFNDPIYGTFDISVNLHTGTLMTTGSPRVIGFEIELERYSVSIAHASDAVEEPDEERDTHGLMTFENAPSYKPGNVEIIVETEEDKQEMLKAIRYLHDSRDIDTRLLMVNSLIHIYHNPDLVKVRR